MPVFLLAVLLEYLEYSRRPVFLLAVPNSKQVNSDLLQLACLEELAYLVYDQPLAISE